MECIGTYYLHNFKLTDSSEFNEDVFKTGNSIYEVIRVEEGIPLFIEKHLNRLFHSADISGLNINEGYCDFESLAEELIKKNNLKKGKIKIIIHFNSDNDNLEKDVLVYITSHYFPTKKDIDEGVELGFCSASRQNPNAKILNTEARQKANHYIVEKQLFEVVLLDSDQCITEGSRSNIFFIKNDIIYTAPQQDVLMGITRSNIIDICNKHNLKLVEKKIHISDLEKMDSAFISGTSLKVQAVRNIEQYNFDTQNKTLRRLIQLYDKLIDDYIKDKLT